MIIMTLVLLEDASKPSVKSVKYKAGSLLFDSQNYHHENCQHVWTNTITQQHVGNNSNFLSSGCPSPFRPRRSTFQNSSLPRYLDAKLHDPAVLKRLSRYDNTHPLAGSLVTSQESHFNTLLHAPSSLQDYLQQMQFPETHQHDWVLAIRA
jgi:hypothetical protein